MSNLQQMSSDIQESASKRSKKRHNKKNEYDYHKKKRRAQDGLSNRKPGQKFAPEEDRLILQLVLSVGPKFQKIHKSFPGKTLAMVKNRYYKYLRYRWDVLGQQLSPTTIRDYKHLNAAPESYETLCEQQKNISSQLVEQKQDLITEVTQRVTQLNNARMFVEYLIDQLL